MNNDTAGGCSIDDFPSLPSEPHCTDESSDPLCSDEIDRILRTSQPQPFVVDSLDGANWWLRKLTEARLYKRRVSEWAEREQRRADAEEARLHYLYGQQIRDWLHAHLFTTKAKAKSLNLPAGVIGFRRTGPTLSIADMPAALSWAKASCPSAIVVKETLLVTALKDHLRATGEIPDGVAVIPQKESFFAR